MWSREKIIEYAQDHPVLAIDGDCILCNNFARVLTQVDKDGLLRFTPLSGLKKYFPESNELDSIILIKDGKFYAESAAFIEIAALMPFPFKAFSGLRILPPVLRDFFYRLIAKYRYRLYGREDQCYLDNHAIRDRLITFD